MIMSQECKSEVNVSQKHFRKRENHQIGTHAFWAKYENVHGAAIKKSNIARKLRRLQYILLITKKLAFTKITLFIII
jgi:hypothetical protein